MTLHRRTRAIAVATICLLLAGLAGCNKKKATAADEPAAKGETTDVTSDRSLQVMNYYVEFFNQVIDEAPAPLRNYFDEAGDDGLTVEDMTKWGNVICAGAGWMKLRREAAAENLAQAKKASTGEFAPLPPLADAMLASGVALVDKRDEACKYIKSGDFKADQGARAKALHGEILAARTAWHTAVDGLGAELDRIEDAQSLAEIGKHQPGTYGFLFRTATFRANELLRMARRDVTKVEGTIAPLELAITEAQALEKAKGAGVHESYAGYMKQVERLAKALPALKKSLAGAKTPAAKEKVIAEKFGDLVSIYNTMISLHNILVAAEGRGDLG
jgi:hypothetical protein